LFFANKPKDEEFYKGVFDNLATYEPNLQTVVALIVSIKRSKMLRELSITSYEVAEGKASFDKLVPLLNGLKEEQSPLADQIEFVNDDLDYLVNEAIAKPGLRWRLTTLNQSLGSLRKGDFGFIFARPETGKTTFLASEVSFMLTQTEGNVVWINNEEGGNKVMLRVYQAFFGVTSEELFANVPKYKKLFQEATQGRFKLYDSAQVDRTTVEAICKKWKPALLVIDQIDKIKGFDADRTDLQLGAIYIWAREIAKEYCPTIGICQADGTGENVRYLTMSNVANAKTSKQAEADWILGIGAIHDQGWETIRFLHISKNKLMGDVDTNSKLRHGKMEVLIQPDVARYKDMR